MARKFQTIQISPEQHKAAVTIIREWFPGPTNQALRRRLRRQLERRINWLQGVQRDPLFPCPKVSLDYGDDESVQVLNREVNRVLGLID